MNERRASLMEELPRLGFAVLMNDLKNPGNIGSIIRSAHSFGCNEVIISGYSSLTQNARKAATKKERWEKITFIDEGRSTLDWMKRSPYDPVVIENSENAVPLTGLNMPDAPVFVFGNEREGVEREIVESGFPVAYIPQIGADKSINVACAAAIVMYTYFLTRWDCLDRVDDWNCCYSPGLGEIKK